MLRIHIVYIGGSQTAFLPLCIVKLKLIHLSVGPRIAVTRKGVIVPQHPIVTSRNDKGDRHLGVVLKELLVTAFVIHFVGLMLTQTVNGLLIVGRRPHLAQFVALHPIYSNGLKASAFGLLL